MAAVTRYECDGPTCHETEAKAPKHSYPPLEVWPRVTARFAGVERVGCFHDRLCALRWLHDRWNEATGTDDTVALSEFEDD